MSSVGIGVVGLGDVALRDYLPELHRLADRAHLVSVYSRNHQQCKVVAERFGAKQAASDLADFLSGDFEIVVNLTPARAHKAITIASLNAGKHVYSEKPLAMTLSDVQDIAKVSAETGRVVAAAPSVVLFPQVRKLRELVAEGAVGPVISVRAQTCGGVPPWEGFDTDPSHFFAADSGPWRDLAVYPLHVISSVFGHITSITAISRRTVDEFHVLDGPHRGLRVPVLVDDDWHASVVTDGGVIADVHVNFAVREPASPEFEVLGREGTMALSLLDVSRPLQVLPAGSPTWKVVPVAAERLAGPDHLLGIEDLISNTTGNRPLTITVDEAAHVVSVLEAGERAARSGERICLSRPEDAREPRSEEGE